jgi:group I intron endonuclease
MKPYGTIYKITCHTTGLSYFGITKMGVRARWKEHIRHSRYPRRHCPVLSVAIKTFGPDNFIVEEFANCFDKEYLSLTEEKLIKQFNTIYPNGMNVASGGYINHQTVEIKAKISSGVKRLWSTPEHRIKVQMANSKPVDSMDPTTGEIKRYFGAVEAARVNGWKHAQPITAAIKGRQPTAFGLLWKYADQKDFLKQPTKPSRQRPQSHKRIPIVAVNIKTGEALSFPCLRDAELSGFYSGAISKALRKKSNTYKGYAWHKAGDYKSVRP